MNENNDCCILNIKITEKIKTYPTETQRKIIDYINQLDEMEKKAYIIAFDHLETSFNIVRSNGFKKWCTTKS